VILQHGISGPARISRHLWRMCLALFFATAFFVLGRQKIMPSFMRGSPLLLLARLRPWRDGLLAVQGPARQPVQAPWIES